MGHCTNKKKNAQTKKFECQQHPVFPGGHPSKYWRCSTLLNFGDRTRTGVFSMIWPLTRDLANNQAFQLGPEDLFEKVSKKVHRWSKASQPTTFSIMYCTFQCTKSLGSHLARQHLCKGWLQTQHHQEVILGRALRPDFRQRHSTALNLDVP